MNSIYDNILEQEKDIKMELINSQDIYNFSKQQLANLNSQLNELRLKQNSYNELKEQIPVKKRNILLISSFCILFCFTEILPLIIIDLLVLLTGLGTNIFKIQKIKKQLKKLNIKNITSNVEDLELLIANKRIDVQEAYKEIDKNHNLLIEINNKKINQEINLENVEYDLKKQYERIKS